MLLKPKNSGIHQLALFATEHIIVSITTFLLSFFAVLYFGLNLESKTTSIEQGVFSSEMNFIFICGGLTVLANIFLYLKNISNSTVREINLNEENGTFTFRFRKGYSNKDLYMEANSNSVQFKKSADKGYVDDKVKKIDVLINGKITYSINLEDAIWSTDKYALRDLRDLLSRD